MSKTARKIIEETRAAYEADPSKTRAVILSEEGDQTGCEYLTEDGRMCGIGRCLIDPRDADGDGLGDGDIHEIWGGHIFNDINDDLKPEYRGHTFGFWDKIQEFHDLPQYWTLTGITPAGIEAYDELIAVYADN